MQICLTYIAFNKATNGQIDIKQETDNNEALTMDVNETLPHGGRVWKA